MIKDNRKAPRKQMRYSAWARLADKSLHGCVLFDISDTGARIEVENAAVLPETFVLLLAGRNSKARRYCRIVWREPHQVGVQFEKPKAVAAEAARTPAATAAAEPAPAAETV